MAVPEAYGSSWGRDKIEGAAAGLCHSHDNAGSKPHLQSRSKLEATPDP